MGDNPRGVRTTPTVLFLRLDASSSAPLAAGELRTSHYPGELFDGVPFPHLLPLDQQNEHGLNFSKPLFQRHVRTLLFHSSRSNVTKKIRSMSQSPSTGMHPQSS